MEERPRSEVLSVQTPLGALPLPEPTRLRPDVTVWDAASAMLESRTDSVILDTEPISILTERDLVRAVADRVGETCAAREIATRDPVTVSFRATVLQTAQLMEQHAVGHLVVVGGAGEVIAVVSARAIAAVLARSSEQSEWVSALRVALRITA